MPVETAILEMAAAEKVLLEQPEHLQGILKSELYKTYRREMEQRVANTL
jgi:hypothetical protein